MKRLKNITKERHSTILQIAAICGMLLFVSCNGGNAINKEKGVNSETKTQQNVTVPKEEGAKFSAADMVGVWDYYAESAPNDKIEIIFKKDGTLIDYIDFHSTGTYKVSEDGSIITMQFFYNDGSTSQESKPFEYKVLEYSKERFKIIHNSPNGKNIIYDRKKKSDNYTGEL